MELAISDLTNKIYAITDGGKKKECTNEAISAVLHVLENKAKKCGEFEIVLPGSDWKMVMERRK